MVTSTCKKAKKKQKSRKRRKIYTKNSPKGEEKSLGKNTSELTRETFTLEFSKDNVENISYKYGEENEEQVSKEQQSEEGFGLEDLWKGELWH